MRAGNRRLLAEKGPWVRAKAREAASGAERVGLPLVGGLVRAAWSDAHTADRIPEAFLHLTAPDVREAGEDFDRFVELLSTGCALPCDLAQATSGLISDFGDHPNYPIPL
jgi:hypothetical protein